jgi:serine/threonine protein kinase
VVRQLICGLDYLHRHNFCHRDIKPENILYDRKEGKVKIIDFGISKRTFSRGVRRDMLTIIGTHFYFAPEIYIGGGYDERVDIWALGVTVYKLIAGRTPFESEYHCDTIANILRGEVTFEEKAWAKYTPFAKDFVSRLLKEKTQRMSLRQSSKHLWFSS